MFTYIEVGYTEQETKLGFKLSPIDLKPYTPQGSFLVAFTQTVMHLEGYILAHLSTSMYLVN